MNLFKKVISSILALGLVLSMGIDTRVYAMENNELDVDIITDDENKEDEVKYEYKVEEKSLIRENIDTKEKDVLVEDLGIWESNEYIIKGVFTQVVVKDNMLFYNTAKQLRKIDLDTLENTLLLEIDGQEELIFGLKEESEKLYFDLKVIDDDPVNYVEFIELEDITVDDMELTIAETKTINVQTTPEDATSQKITYQSSDEEVATVDEEGHVKGIGEGSAKITVVMGNGISQTFDVTVKRAELKGISIPESKSIYLDDEEKIEITTDPKEGTIIENVQWEVLDETIATVDSDGMIKPLAVGETTVKAIVKDEEQEFISNEMTLVVLPLYYDSITVKNKDIAINIDEQQPIEVVGEPEDVKYKEFTYESLDEKIATVDEKGNITGISEGTTKINITTQNGLKEVVDVTVNKVELDSVKIDESLTMYQDDMDKKINLDLDPKDATIESVEWIIEKVDDKEIATIDEKGNINPLAAGETIVKVKVNGVESNEMKLVILPLYYKNVVVKDLTVNVGESKNLDVVTDPVNVKYDELTYMSEDTSIATVDKDGNVKGIKEGQTDIIVIYKDKDGNDKSVSVKITVKKIPVEKIKLDAIKIELGKTKTLKVNSIYPTNATYQKVTWSISNSEKKKGVISLDKGVIKAKKIGTATIIATVDGKKAQCKVTVNPALTLSNSKKTININQSFTLKATTKGVSSKNVKYSSSKTSVATVNSKGKVIGKKAGTATITVKVSCKVNKVTYTTTKTCKVTVKSVAVKSVKLNKKSASLTYGSTLQLKATVSPSNASNKKVTWSSSNKSVATVSSSGKVTTKKVGSATITVKTVNGKKATCKISVKRKSISGARVSYQTTYTYTGKSIRPSVSVKVGSKTLRKGTDYTVSYGTNKKSKGTIRITGKGNYSGTITKTFTIKEKKETMSSPSVKAITGGFKVSYSRGKNASGYQIAYSTSRSSGFRTVSTRSLSKTISGLKRNKTYYVKVRFYKSQGGKKVYSNYSSVRSVKTK